MSDKKKNQPSKEFATSSGSNPDDAAKELPTSGELPDPEAMKLYETTKREEPANKGSNNSVGDADDHTGYDYRGNK
jgi:hypothetical protein